MLDRARSDAGVGTAALASWLRALHAYGEKRMAIAPRRRAHIEAGKREKEAQLALTRVEDL